MTDAVAVPSHARIEETNAKTLRLLAERGVDRDLVHVVVARAELDPYRAGIDRGLCADIVEGGPTLAGQRNAIQRLWPEGSRVVSADDDLVDVLGLEGDELRPVPDLPALFDRGFAACDEAGATLWGTYPVLNPFYMRPGTSTRLAFCIGHLVGLRTTPAKWARLTLRCKDDYEQTLLRYEHDGAVVRLNDVAAKTKMQARGGLAAALQDRQTANRRDVAELVRRWPQWVQITPRRSGQGLEIRLRA